MRFTIRTKLIAGFGLLICLMVISATVAYIKMHQATQLESDSRQCDTRQPPPPRA